MNTNIENMYDFVLLDLDMPISNGYEACKNIQMLFNSESKLFNTGLPSKTKKYAEQEFIKRKTSFLVKSKSKKNVLAKTLETEVNCDIMPVIVACSGYVDTKT